MGWLTQDETGEGIIKVLFVDDDPSWGKLLDGLLQSVDETIVVQSVNDVQEAREYVEEMDIDCVVSDYKMPGETGIELLEKLRERQTSLPFILLTAKGDESVASKAIAAGVDDYLTKNIAADRPELLANRIRNTVTRHRNAQAQIESEARYRTIADTVADSICLFQDDELIYVNEQFCDLTGRSKEKLTRLPFADFLHEHDREICERVLDGKTIQNTEVRIVDEQGSIRYCLLNAKQISLGNEPATACVFNDITEQKEREKQLKQYELFIENSSDTILLLDEAGNVTYQSPVPEHVPYGEPRDLVGSSPQEFVHPDDVNQVLDAFNRLIQNPDEIDRTVYRFKTSDGEWRWFENIAQNYTHHPEISGVLVAVRDVHEREQIQQQLRRELRLKEAVWDILVHYSSKEEIAERFCQQLVEEYEGDLASLVIDSNAGDGAVNPQVVASVGEPKQYISTVYDLPREQWNAEPGAKALRENEFVVAGTISGESSDWESHAVQHGITSAIGIPIQFEGIKYGAITVYSNDEDTINRYHIAPLLDLAGTIGYALSAIVIREAFVAGTDQYVRIELTGDQEALNTLSSDNRLASTPVQINTILPGDDSDLFYGITSASVEQITNVFSDTSRVESYEVDTAPNSDTRFKVELKHPTISEVILEHHGVFESATLQENTVEVTVRLPSTTPVSDFVESLRSRYSSVRVTASGSLENRAPSRTDLLGALTERQREAIQIAFHRGYFEQPKGANAADIAADLGIDRSTFTQHLRSAERKILSAIFD